MSKEKLEEAAERYANFIKDEDGTSDIDFIEGANWQKEKMYSEEDVKTAFRIGFSIGYGSDTYAIDERNEECNKWFEQFKK